MDIFEWDENIPVTANNLNEMQNILNDNISENVLDKYSTNETIIGIWIDNKPIYRKVFKITNIPQADTPSYVDISTLGIDRCVNLRGFTHSNSLGYIDINFYEGHSYNFAHLDDNHNIIYVRHWDASEIYFIIEYTKVAD